MRNHLFLFILLVLSSTQLWAKNVTLTQKNINEALNTPKTTYVVKSPIDLQGSTIVIPEDYRIKFKKGGFVNGMVQFTNTEIVCKKRYGILQTDVSGTITNEYAYPEWLAENGDQDFSACIQKLITIKGDKIDIRFTCPKYKVSGDRIFLDNGVTLSSKSNSTIWIESNDYYKSILFQDYQKTIDDINIIGLAFDQTANLHVTEMSKAGNIDRFCVLLYNAKNVTIKDCHFKYIGSNAVSVNGYKCNNTSVLNNEFYFVRAHIPNDKLYDVSAIYICDHKHVIKNNLLTNDGTEFNRPFGGIESHGPEAEISNNRIDNTGNAIYIVNNQSIENGDVVKRNIHHNYCDGCNVFINFWPFDNFDPISNINIFSNTAKDVRYSAIRCTYNPNERVLGDIQNVHFYNNTISGMPHVFDNTEDNDTYTYSIFNIEGVGNISEFVIENNTLKDFPGNIIRTGRYIGNRNPKQEVIIRSNEFLNSNNATIASSYNTYLQFALITMAYGDAKFVNNKIKMHPDTEVPPVIYSILNKSCVLQMEGNDWENISALKYADNGSAVISDIAVTRTSKSVKLINAILHIKNNYGYYTCDNTSELNVGDTFTIEIEGKKLNETIVAIVKKQIFTESTLSLRNKFGSSNRTIDK